jgi:cell fate (sporulation/competence/biofilm development) regulator YlbF (YheA/YmcA/DUF963 family)
MNVYDEAHSLAKSIKESGEYKEYMGLKKQIESTPELKSMLEDFQARQFEVQAKQLMGEEVTPEMTAQLQSVLSIMSQDPLAAQYLQSEMRFNMMMNDVYQILGEVMGLAKYTNGE